MKTIVAPLTKVEIAEMRKEYGDYIKVTADIENKIIVAGIELHADAESLLLQKGGVLDHLWGGGVNFITRDIDATAVYNIRPRLGNNNLEILDPDIRRRFIELVKYMFAQLYD